MNYLIKLFYKTNLTLICVVLTKKEEQIANFLIEVLSRNFRFYHWIGLMYGCEEMYFECAFSTGAVLSGHPSPLTPKKLF